MRRDHINTYVDDPGVSQETPNQYDVLRELGVTLNAEEESAVSGAIRARLQAGPKFDILAFMEHDGIGLGYRRDRVDFGFIVDEYLLRSGQRASPRSRRPKNVPDHRCACGRTARLSGKRCNRCYQRDARAAKEGA